MRHTIAGFATALIVLGAGAAPAAACGGYGCAPCSTAAPCGVAYSGYGYDYVAFERLPTIAVPRWYAVPQYYYVNQGPTYTGPGAFAPLPAYQQRAVRSRYGYGYGYGHGYYHGGPYANAMTHFYAGAPAWSGPAIISTRSRVRRHGVAGHYHRHPAMHARHHRQHYAGPYRHHRR